MKQDLQLLLHKFFHLIKFIFLRFYINFTSSLFNASRVPGPKCKFFLHLGPVAQQGGDCRPGRGRQGYSFEIFRNRHIFLKFCFFNIKMKKAPQSDSYRALVCMAIGPLYNFDFKYCNIV